MQPFWYNFVAFLNYQITSALEAACKQDEKQELPETEPPESSSPEHREDSKDSSVSVLFQSVCCL